LALFAVTPGSLSKRWAEALRFLFGWASYALAAIAALGGLALVAARMDENPSVPVRRVFGLEVAVLASLGLFHLLIPGRDSYLLASQGAGGGVVGWAAATAATSRLGFWGGFAALALVSALGIILALDVSASQIAGRLDRLADRATATAHQMRVLRNPELAEQLAPPTESAEPPEDASPGEAEAGEEPPSAPPADTRSLIKRRRPARKPLPTGPRRAATVKKSAPHRRPRRPGRRRMKPPPLKLLRRSKDQTFSAADARAKAKIIEETLASFGVPARVVEINSGPTVTQFGVRPGYIERRDRSGKTVRRKVKVSKITALADDLALALAARSVRIEAPVPGRPVVGIEVPNTDVALVSLRGVMESNAFRRLKAPLRIALGRNVTGTPVVADLAAMPHLLIAGATGSGKSVCINSIIAALLFRHTPETLRLLMIDPKMVELVNFNGIPHLLAPVVVDLEAVVGALTWAMHEMEERYKLFARLGVRNLITYNQKVAKQGGETLPYIVVLIDELADLMMSAPEAIERLICRIAQMARATGIHLVVATQRPSVDVVTGLIKANFPARISFAVTSMVDSRVVLDMPGAEKLLGQGDMLFLAPDAPAPVRLQGCFVSDEELDALVEYWVAQVPPDEEEGEEVPWKDIEVALPEEGEDELLSQAIALAQEHGQISASFLQRKLRIGYNRASRLMDVLESRGIVGPPQSGGRPRQVLASASAAEATDEGPEEVADESVAQPPAIERRVGATPAADEVEEAPEGEEVPEAADSVAMWWDEDEEDDEDEELAQPTE
jgi:S-DNA-T family DNA segregation ATPase FtsK/SpoIIIE